MVVALGGCRCVRCRVPVRNVLLCGCPMLSMCPPRVCGGTGAVDTPLRHRGARTAAYQVRLFGIGSTRSRTDTGFHAPSLVSAHEFETA
eukprot:3813811-Prymnesium_polylepis.1